MIIKLLSVSAIFCLIPLHVFADDFETIDSNTKVLNGHVYEVKTVGSVPKGQGIYIDMVIDPSQDEINLKRFKVNVGSDWGVVSNDSKDTIHLDSIKQDGDSKVIITGSEAQDTDEITVKIELSAFDSSKDQFTDALVNIIGDVDNGHGVNKLTLSLENLHLRVIKIK